jgi:hypothetical protein
VQSNRLSLQDLGKRLDCALTAGDLNLALSGFKALFDLGVFLSEVELGDCLAFCSITEVKWACK